MNINDSSAIRLCTSCQMCAAVCPKNIINIKGIIINNMPEKTIQANINLNISLNNLIDNIPIILS